MAKKATNTVDTSAIAAATMALLVAAGVTEGNFGEVVEGLLTSAEEEHDFDVSEIRESMGGDSDSDDEDEDEDEDDESPLAFMDELEEDDLRELAIKAGVVKKAKAAKMDEDALREALEGADEDDVVAAADELGFTDDSDEDEEDEEDEPEYDDLDKEELVALVVERGLAKKAKAAKMSEDDLIEMLESADEDE